MTSILNKVRRVTAPFVAVMTILVSSLVTCVTAEELILSKGETVYVSIYSHIFVGSGKRQVPYALSINLSIRNTDPNNAITIVKADYYDSNGNLIQKSLEKPVVLPPLASTYLHLAQNDTSGDWGANYIIKWQAETEVNQPIIESLTHGVRGTHAISFVFPGKVIKE